MAGLRSFAVGVIAAWTVKQASADIGKYHTVSARKGLGREVCGTWGMPYDSHWQSDVDTPIGVREKGWLSSISNFSGTDKQEKTKMVRTIILIRHGQYTNEAISDDSIRHLTTKGKMQAARSAKRIKELSDANVIPPPTALVCSNLLRAKMTAVPFASTLNLTAQVEPDLAECFPCPPEPPISKTSRIEPESLRRQHHQAETAFKRLFCKPQGDEESVVVIGHANVIRYFVLRALQLPPEAWLRMSLPHTSHTIMRVSSSGGVSLRCYGDAGFLPADMVTTRNEAEEAKLA